MSAKLPIDTDQFVAACRSAALAHDAVAAVRWAVEDVVGSLTAGETQLAPLDARYACRSGNILLGRDCTLYEDDTVTVSIVETEPGHLQPAHDHGMPAVIGVFEGGESNRFFRRTPTGVRLATRRVVHAGEVIAMRDRTVHAISAHAGAPCRALHVYLGCLSQQSRTLFHPDTGAGEPFEFETYLRYVRSA